MADAKVVNIILESMVLLRARAHAAIDEIRVRRLTELMVTMIEEKKGEA